MSRVLLAIVVLLVLLVGGCKKPVLPEPELPAGNTDPAPPPARRGYVGDLTQKVFYQEDCPDLENVELSQQRLLESPGEALDRGFAPCKTCNPLRGW